jgi:hypothetical protein
VQRALACGGGPGETWGVLPRRFLVVLAGLAVVDIVRRLLERERARREESIEERLARLDELLQREMITRPEYEEARLRIISGETDPPHPPPLR